MQLEAVGSQDDKMNARLDHSHDCMGLIFFSTWVPVHFVQVSEKALRFRSNERVYHCTLRLREEIKSTSMVSRGEVPLEWMLGSHGLQNGWRSPEQGFLSRLVMVHRSLLNRGDFLLATFLA